LRRASRRWLGGAQRVITISATSKRALLETYDLASDVVYPPVRTTFFTPSSVERRHFLTVGRLVPHKRVEVAVDAFARLNRELVVVGTGSEDDSIRGGAPSNVRFVGYVDDASLRDLYRSSLALICPSVEEFGIVMAEALSCGTPVIAPKEGGALEIIEHGVTGLLLDRFDADSVAVAVADLHAGSFDADACRRAALRFSEDRFVNEIKATLEAERAIARGTSLAGQELLEPVERSVGQELARALTRS
jgi:glycosyltransferase involved in cell wall biosynthesis